MAGHPKYQHNDGLPSASLLCCVIADLLPQLLAPPTKTREGVLDVHQEAEQLRQVPIFSKLDPSKLKLLAFTSEAVTFNNGEVLFRVNEPSDCTYVILDGEVEILTEMEDGTSVPVLTMGRNSLIGELAVLRNTPRSATVRALGSVRTLRIGNDLFLQLVSENANVALDIMRQLGDKLTQTHMQLEETQRRLRRFEHPSG